MFYHPFVFKLYNRYNRKTVEFNLNEIKKVKNNLQVMVAIRNSSFFNRKELFLGDVFFDKNDTDNLYILRPEIKNECIVNIDFFILKEKEEKLVPYKEVIENKLNLVYLTNLFMFDDLTDNSTINIFLEKLYFKYGKEFSLDFLDDLYLFFVENNITNDIFNFRVTIKRHSNDKIHSVLLNKLKDYEDYLQLNEDYCQILLGYHSKRLCESSNYLPKMREKALAYDFILLPSGSIFIKSEERDLNSVYIDMKINHSHINFTLNDLEETVLFIPKMNELGIIEFYNQYNKKIEPIIHPESMFYQNYLCDFDNNDYLDLYLKII